ncbi:MAG: phosphatidate cytidylyltransferase [Gallionella sp.]|nr:phosphatidate cytidylyltransferase [Gallionella sp.]
MLKSRIITALIMLVLLLAALFGLPASAWVALVILMALQASLEWARLSKLTGRAATVYWVATLFIMLSLVWVDASTTAPQQLIHLFVYLIAAFLWIIVVPTWMIVGWKVESPLLMSLTGWAVIIPTSLAMLDLRLVSPWLLLFIMCLVWVADSAAYFAGRKFGKNKLAPSISPGKTWEGVAGAMLGVTAYIVLVWSMSPSLSQYAMLPILLLAAWWWVGLAVIGDLFESAIKRQACVKDSGALLPGHGGLLDRIDALTSTLPLAALVITMQQLS